MPITEDSVFSVDHVDKEKMMKYGLKASSVESGKF